MCGICGVVQVGGEPRAVIEPHVLDHMTDVMTHRGPNDRGTYLAPGIGLGVRRLSIVDVQGGHQPFANEDGTVWAVQNGELYNHDELRTRLRHDGHVFTSRCDTEILPHLYERYGPRCVDELRGKYGLAVWDARRRQTVVARDRLGVKPMYYAQSGDLVVFASELKSLLASGLVEPGLDYEAIDVFLDLGFFPGPRTPLAAVHKLMPGHRLVVDANGVRTEAYWRYPQPTVDSPRLSDREYADGLLTELDEAVRLRLMSDVPLGAMLSGGLDSSLIVALMSRHMTEPVKTFSVGFLEDHDHNELADARYVADVYGTDHHELELSYADSGLDLPDLVWFLDEPIADLSALGFLAISELAARHVTVALSGQGADELLAGYKKHRAAWWVTQWRRMPYPARVLAEGAARRAPARFGRAARTLTAGGPVERLLAMSARIEPDLRRELLRGPLGDPSRRPAYAAVADIAGNIADDPLPASLYIDGQLALVDDMLQYFDRASMAHSLEVRVPFLDHRVVEYCARIPGDLKVRRLRTKHVLKEAARGLVPDRIIDKRKLGFFRHASDGWLRAQMDGAVSEYLLGANPRTAEFLDRRALERLVAGHRDGTGSEHVHLLIGILLLEIWLSTYLPRAIDVPAPTRDQIRIAV
jgi:asparagine synthase (glutamine-hydrolysing)